MPATRGPPGSRRSSSSPSLKASAAADDFGSSDGGVIGSSSGGGSGGSSRPRKTSRLLLYLRLRYRELLRPAAAVAATLVLLVLSLRLLSAALGWRPAGSTLLKQQVQEGEAGGGSSPHRFRSLWGRKKKGIAEGGRGRGDLPPAPPLIRNPRADGLGLGFGVAGRPVDEEGGVMAGHGTDVYEARRDGEILSQWDPEFGLEIDAWDPRTHDPLETDLNKYGHVVHVKPTSSSEKRWYILAVIFNRVFENDVMGITPYECLQWLEYYRYAGVSHVVWYDTAQHPQESVEATMRPHVRSGFVTYHEFHSLFPGGMDKGVHYEQDHVSIHALETYGADAAWMLSVDVDEYLNSPVDLRPGFLDRILRTYDDAAPSTSQLLLQTFMFLGDPQKDPPSLLIESYTQRSPQSEGVSLSPDAMMKVLVRPDHVSRVFWNDPHHFELLQGKTVAVPAAKMRVYHYWGARLIDVDIADRLVADTSLQAIADEIGPQLKKQHLKLQHRHRSFIWARRPRPPARTVRGSSKSSGGVGGSSGGGSSLLRGGRWRTAVLRRRRRRLS